jgi:hypothetical protein
MSEILRAMGRGLAQWLRPAPLAALTIALLAFLPALLVPGLVATRAGGDSPFLLQRTQQMAEALAAYHFPARWMPEGAFGLGYPFWNFYAPLSYLFAGLVALLGSGVVGAIKVVQLAAFLFAAAGMFRLAERVWGGPWSGFLGSAAYTLAPYHLVNVYARGDALAELAAYAVFPWLLLALDAARERHGPLAVAALAAAFAALILSHNISALMFLPVLALYWFWPRRPTALDSAAAPHRASPPAAAPARAAGPLWARPAGWTLDFLDGVEWRAWGRWRGLRFRGALAVSAGLLLGLALAAWFWAPALAERDQVQLADNTTGYFSYEGHFLALDALDVGAVFDYTVDARHSPWRLGLLQLLVALAGAVVAWRAGQKRTVALWGTVALAAVLMMTVLSAPLWGAIPLLAFLQFPWRWLAIAAFALALLSAPLGRRGPWVALPVALLLGLSTLLGLDVQTLAVDDVTLADVAAFEVFSNNPGTTVRGEYMPTAVRPRPASSVTVVDGRPGTPRSTSGIATTTLLRRGPAAQEWQVEVSGDQPATVAFPTLYFPGWTATITSEGRQRFDQGAGPSGEPIPTPTPYPAPEQRTVRRAAGVAAGSGWLTVELPPGRSKLRLALERSDGRALAEGLSLAALLLWLALVLADRRYRLRVGLAWLVLGLMLAVVLARTLPVGRPLGPRTLDNTRAAWPHYNPSGLSFGEARLASARLSADEVAPGTDLDVTLNWRAAPEDHDVSLALVSPAEVVQDVPDVRAEATAPLVDGDDRLTLSVPGDTVDGLYFVRLRVSQDDEPQPAESHDGWQPLLALRQTRPSYRIGDVYLGPVRVHRSEPGTTTSAAPLKRMGDASLLDLRTKQDGDRLRVDLTWQADRDTASEYKTSVRLKDSSGKQVAQSDDLPMYGYFPSTAWPVGESWLDHRWLDLPKGLAPGSYTVEVVLYTEDPDAELGTARVPGVTIAAVRADEVGAGRGSD